MPLASSFCASVGSTRIVDNQFDCCKRKSSIVGGEFRQRFVMTAKDDDYDIVFRRFRRTKSGALLDAWKFGIKAWPIKVPRQR